MAAASEETRNEHSSGGAVICHPRRRAACRAHRHAQQDALGTAERRGQPRARHPKRPRCAKCSRRPGSRRAIVKPLDTIEYFFRAGDTLIQKRVDFYLMEYVAGELEPQLSEVDDVEWVELSAAMRRASFDSERKLLEMALQDLSSAVFFAVGASPPLSS